MYEYEVYLSELDQRVFIYGYDLEDAKVKSGLKDNDRVGKVVLLHKEYVD